MAGLGEEGLVSRAVAVFDFMRCWVTGTDLVKNICTAYVDFIEDPSFVHLKLKLNKLDENRVAFEVLCFSTCAGWYYALPYLSKRRFLQKPKVDEAAHDVFSLKMWELLRDHLKHSQMDLGEAVDPLERIGAYVTSEGFLTPFARYIGFAAGSEHYLFGEIIGQQYCATILEFCHSIVRVVFESPTGDVRARRGSRDLGRSYGVAETGRRGRPF